MFTDKEFIEQVSLWPVHPLLPMKRRSENKRYECGFIFCGDEKPTVYLDTIFPAIQAGLAETKSGMSINISKWQKILERFEDKIEYSSVDEMLNARWKVD